jgi:hypothetical protein
MKQSYIYVIAPLDQNANQCKLGISVDPDRRLRQLQTGFPSKLAVHHREPVKQEDAHSLEKLLHRDIGHHRLQGEWFSLSVNEAIGFIKYVIIQYSSIEDLKFKTRFKMV